MRDEAVPPPTIRFGDGRFTVVAALGTGPAGGVFRARDRDTGEERAVKILDVATAQKESVDRFLAEARALERLRHPHVVRAWAQGREHGFVWYAMDLLPGGSLRDHVADRGPVPVEHALALGFQVLMGLHAVHEMGIVHRDVKLTNVLIDADGNARLTDFGVARHPAGTVEFETIPGAAVGTEGYGAPEQWGGAGPVGPRADLYATGVLLYRLLTRRTPHHLHLGRYRPALLADLPGPLRDVLLAATHPEQESRPATAEALARDLVRVRDALLGRDDEATWMDGFDRAAVTGTDAFDALRRWLARSTR